MENVQCPYCGSLDYETITYDNSFDEDYVWFKWTCCCSLCRKIFYEFSTYRIVEHEVVKEEDV